MGEKLVFPKNKYARADSQTLLCIFFKDDFFIWTFSWVFIEFVTVLSLFWFFWPQSMWDVRSLTRDQTCTLCIERQTLNPGAPGKVPVGHFNSLCVLSRSVSSSL